MRLGAVVAVAAAALARDYLDAWVAAHPEFNGYVLTRLVAVGRGRWRAVIRFGGRESCAAFDTGRWTRHGRAVVAFGACGSTRPAA